VHPSDKCEIKIIKLILFYCNCKTNSIVKKIQKYINLDGAEIEPGLQEQMSNKEENNISYMLRLSLYDVKCIELINNS